MALRWAELTGAVGAGKSALMPVAMTAIRESGRTATPIDELSAGRAASRWERASAAVRFGLAEPRLTRSIARALLSSPLTWAHRKAIGTLLFRLAAATHAAQGRLEDEVVVADEGWVHRAVNLYGWTPGSTASAMAAYLAAIPRPDVLIVVDAPADVRAERLQRRGLPKRLRDKDEATIEAFLERSAAIVEVMAQRLERDGVHVIRVDNADSLEASTSALSARLRGLMATLPPRSCLPPIVRFMPPFPLPRPGRAMLPTRRQAAPGSLAELREVLDAYGIVDPRARLLDRSGRSMSVLVQAPTGPAVLKRYKSTLGTDSIRCQHSILLELEGAGFPSPRLVPARDGSLLVEREAERYDLTRLVAGYARWDRSFLLPGDSRRLRAAAGAALAGLHELLIRFEPDHDHEARVSPARTSDALMTAIADARSSTVPDGSTRAWSSLWERGDEIRDSMRTMREELDGAELPVTVIHGDYGPYNLLVRHGRPIHIMDLELSRRDWRAIDLARAIPRFATNRLGYSTGRARRFLDGYLERTAVTTTELTMLPVLSAYLDLRRCVVAWQRYADGGETRWLDAALRHLRDSDKARRGDHPLALLSDMDNQEVH